MFFGTFSLVLAFLVLETLERVRPCCRPLHLHGACWHWPSTAVGVQRFEDVEDKDRPGLNAYRQAGKHQ